MSEEIIVSLSGLGLFAKMKIANNKIISNVCSVFNNAQCVVSSNDHMGYSKAGFYYNNFFFYFFSALCAIYVTLYDEYRATRNNKNRANSNKLHSRLSIHRSLLFFFGKNFISLESNAKITHKHAHTTKH